MKRVLCSFILACMMLLLTQFSLAEGSLQDSFELRSGVKFGMSKSQVKATETLKIKSDGSVLKYEGTVAGKSGCVVEYYFDNGKLMNETLNVATSGSSVVTINSDFSSFETALKDKYGDPIDNSNGIGATYVGTSLNGMLTMSKMMPGVNLKCSEWLITEGNEHIKINHILLSAKAGSSPYYSHIVEYEYFSSGSISNDL